MTYLLFGYHDNRPMNKYFLLIFAHFGPKQPYSKNYRCKVSTLKLGGMIALFMLNLKKLISIEVGEPTFLGGQVEK